MSSREPDAQGFRELWPTLMLQRTLPGHEQANAVFESLILEMDQRNAELTTGYRDQNLFAVEHPALGWLMQCIHKSASDYCARSGIDYPIDWTLQGWANVNRTGDYHDPHNHPHAYLSGTYYVRVPAGRATPANRNDVRPGCISFYDPRGVANMTAIRRDPQVEPELTVQPQPGLLLMWPAFLLHYVHPNLSEQPRISISFNLLLKDPARYLPGQ